VVGQSLKSQQKSTNDKPTLPTRQRRNQNARKGDKYEGGGVAAHSLTHSGQPSPKYDLTVPTQKYIVASCSTSLQQTN
jgi:hypothetical protein